VGATPGLKEPRLLGGALFWLEQRPQERGRTTLWRRPAPGRPAEELTPGDWNLRSRVHEYGGGACAIGLRSNGQPVAVFVHDGDRRLWRLDLEADASGSTPQALCAAGAYGGGLIDARHDRWIGVLESEGRDHLVAVPLAGGEPPRRHNPADFCGYPVLSATGSHLAWVEWQQPCMPWERSQLWLGQVDGEGRLHDCRVVAGSASGDPQAISVFQPLWAGDDLVVANDRSGWWNLERLPAATQLTGAAAAHWQPLLPLQAEFAMPQWVFGVATHAWDGERLLACACQIGRASCRERV
jgi:hypothetical protein